MGFGLVHLKAMKPHIRGRVLSLGYPDLLITDAEAEQYFGIRPTKFTDRAVRHSMAGQIPESREFFSLLGAELTCVDVQKFDGVDVVADLNHPQDLGQYDLVIDPGTVEHCFNVGTAILNAANAVKVGGSILQGGPLSMMNHGFYNLNPTLFYDLYTQNGWDVKINIVDSDGRYGPVPAVQRFKVAPECSLLVLATRKSDAALRLPVQTKYLKGITGAEHERIAA